MIDILKLVFGNICNFLGVTIMLGMVINFIAFILKQILDGVMVWKHGWPPNKSNNDS